MKPDLIVIKKKKLIANQMNVSSGHEKNNISHTSFGTDFNESKESQQFVPSPELGEDSGDSSLTSVTHDTYSVSTIR